MTPRRTPALAGLCLAALTLAACDGPRHMAANSKVCVDFKAAKAAPTPGAEGAGAVDECVKRWAYSLASSRDDAGTVANAVVAACGVQLSRWNQTAVNDPGADVQATSILTGEQTNPLSEHSAFTNGRALFYVVQARAGACAPPPITNGVPDGIG